MYMYTVYCIAGYFREEKILNLRVNESLAIHSVPYYITSRVDEGKYQMLYKAHKRLCPGDITKGYLNEPLEIQGNSIPGCSQSILPWYKVDNSAARCSQLFTQCKIHVFSLHYSSRYKVKGFTTVHMLLHTLLMNSGNLRNKLTTQ